MHAVRSVGEDVDAAVAALPIEFLAAFAEVRVALEVAPHSVGRPFVSSNPRGSRTTTFGPDGRGLLIFAIEDTTRQVVWLWQITVAPDVHG